MSPRSPASLSDGEVGSGSSDDGEKVTINASYRSHTDIDPSARLASSSRLPRHSDSRNAHFGGGGTSGTARDRQRSRSPYRRDRSRSRSPFRAGKQTGREKRRHDEDHYSSTASDSRRHKIRENRSPRAYGYRDPDRPVHQSNGISHLDDSRVRDRTSTRERSRSPYRAQRHRHTHSASDENDVNWHRGNLSAQRESTLTAVQGEADAKPRILHSEKQASATDDTSKASVGSAEQNETAAKKLSEAELIEQRRKKREAIRKKHASSSGTDLLRATLESNLPSSANTPHPESSHGSGQPSPPSSANSPGTPKDSTSAPASPAEFAAVNDEDLVNPLQVNAVTDDQEQSAADYDPNQDKDEDRPEFKRLDIRDDEHTAAAKPSAPIKKSDDFDMFADDDDDMFAINDVPAAKTAAKQAQTLDESLLDNWDYPDGHYRIINGELLDGRFAVEQQVGKGTFATVVRALDTNTGHKVAIKIACRNDTMLKAGQKEMQFLNRLNERDPDDKRYIIRLLGNFTHKGHLCLVFEGLLMDLRELLKKFGRDIGINLEGVKVYAYQMFQALLHMKSAEVLHADLKPDNILVNEKHTLIKVCDFGTATLQQDAELTPYLVSRFYRAPEVILGMDFDYAIDMWAIGCTLYELYAGRILFNGSDNNNMLRVIQECRGKLPNRLIKRAKLADKYFDDSFTFHGLERDKMTGNIVHRPMHFAQGLAGKDLKSRLSGNLNKMTSTMLREHHAFVDLLDKCLQLDPEKRIKPKDALHHQFFARPSQHSKTKVPSSTATFRPITVQHSG